MSNEPWTNDTIQFARLLAEISAVVDISKKDFEALAESMDLGADEINELFDRAQRAFEKSKARYAYKDDVCPDCGEEIKSSECPNCGHAFPQVGEQSETMKATCPNDPTHKRFVTGAHVAEDWVVDEHGNYIETNEPRDAQVTHKPDPGNTWTCKECGSEAIVES